MKNLLPGARALPHWPDPPRDPSLPENEVHIWRLPLIAPETRIRALRETLDEQELRRADRFRFSQHRRHFIVARGGLRVLLGRYLQRPPEQIDFEYNQYGKPFLKDTDIGHCEQKMPDHAGTGDSGTGAIEFNLSHSGEIALYAFSLNRRVGIDIEWAGRKINDSEQIITRFFSPREVEVLSGLPAHLDKTVFLACWTRKEAYIKALGKGLSLPLDQFEIIPTSRKALLTNHRMEFNRELPILNDISVSTTDDSRAACWTIRTFTPDADYMATIVAEGRKWETRYWRWKWDF
uniref:4'-phosphopantetheinyl transferase n=1 Tax=Candidatus Kentrum sp. FW TaxID=2126338 RepID=A0A450TKA7_9GAMM|nr:MAG: 4'-phosphopantetheinyl transferase [Candidatus Kentron sp. FW]